MLFSPFFFCILARETNSMPLILMLNMVSRHWTCIYRSSGKANTICNSCYHFVTRTTTTLKFPLKCYHFQFIVWNWKARNLCWPFRLIYLDSEQRFIVMLHSGFISEASIFLCYIDFIIVLISRDFDASITHEQSIRTKYEPHTKI